MSSPAVSILVPTYNYARYLPVALQSVLAQDFRDFELLVSDDASTDGTAELLHAWSARDPRLRCVVHRRNLGMVENWNWCLQQARGRYVRFLFGDDLLASPDALGRLVDLLDREPRAQLAASSRVLLDEKSQIVGLADELTSGYHDGPALIARCLSTRTNLIGEPSVVMFRRPAEPITFDARYRQIVDLEFWFQLLRHGGLVYTPEPLCGFRRHATQQTAVNHRSAQPHIEMLDLLDQYLALPAVSAQLPPGSFAHQRMLFCQLHYARKSRVDAPAFIEAMRRLDHQLRPAARPVCWLLRRLGRPPENFTRNLRSWRARQARSLPWLNSAAARSSRFIAAQLAAIAAS